MLEALFMSRSNRRRRGRPRSSRSVSSSNYNTRSRSNQSSSSPARSRARARSPSRRPNSIDIPSPRRYSPRLNRLQANGDIARASARLNPREDSSRRNLIDSIIDSARQPSVGTRNNNLPSYNAHYRDNQRNNNIERIVQNNVVNELNDNVINEPIRELAPIAANDVIPDEDAASENVDENNENINNDAIVDLAPILAHDASQNEDEVIQNDNDTFVRICHCDQPVIPRDCEECNVNLNIPCVKHAIITCNNNLCNKRFHAGCLSQFFGYNIEAITNDNYICVECTMKSETESIAWENLNDESIKLKRFGLEATQPFRKVNKMLNVMTVQCDTPTVAIMNIMDNDPKPHASITPISQESIEKHILCGRRFDVSMLMYSVNSCSCCGRTEPVHLDPEFPFDAPFERKHFIHKYMKAWHCKCQEYCKGSQFYSYRKRSSLDMYRDNHNGQSPWEFMNLNQDEPNSLLCFLCHDEISSRQAPDLQFARSFSFRNGFGPTHKYPLQTYVENMNITNGRRLQSILMSLTSAEEAAIRQITPLVSLVRLSTGSIGMKGNTSCVWQQSRLNLI